MNSGYFKKVVGMLFLVFVFCSIAEASGATRSYRMSVTIPATSFVQAKENPSSKIQNQEMQITMERDIRDNQIVMVKTAITK